MKEEYYNTETPKELLDSRNQYINERWSQLMILQSKYADEIIKYLFLVNSGGAIAVLSYLGTGSNMLDTFYAKMSLLSFALGIVFVGIVRAFLIHRSYNYLNAWQRDVQKYHKQEISWQELIALDDNRTKNSYWEFVFGYLSALCFIIGIVLGSIGSIDKSEPVAPRDPVEIRRPVS